MGIDRISSRPPSVPVTEQHLPSPGGTGATSFASTLAGSVESSPKIEPAATALQQLQAGQIDRASYLISKCVKPRCTLRGFPPTSCLRCERRSAIDWPRTPPSLI